jgi:hypothetical protein
MIVVGTQILEHQKKHLYRFPLYGGTYSALQSPAPTHDRRHSVGQIRGIFEDDVQGRYDPGMIDTCKDQSKNLIQPDARGADPDTEVDADHTSDCG